MLASWFAPQHPFVPDTDIPSLAGKVILVTGGNTGLGKETIAQLAKHDPELIFLAARTEQKAATAIAEIRKQSASANIEYLPLDLSSFASVAAAAKHVRARSDRLDILINNAGIMNLPFSLTTDGYEIQFGTNHMGHALLTKLLLPVLLRTAEESASDVRVVNLSSAAHLQGALAGGVILDSSWRANSTAPIRYGSSKLANILHARALRDRYPQLTVTSVHPGVLDTQLFDATIDSWRGVPLVGSLVIAMIRSILRPPAEGALNQLWAATAPKADVRADHYFVPVGKRHGGWFFVGRDRADRLWDWTEAEFKNHGF